MKLKKKVKYVIVFVFIDILLCCSIYHIFNAANMNNLKKEIKDLTSLNISIDRFNRRNKTSFKYKVVETTIKDFLDSFSIRMNDVYGIVSDEEFVKILSYENYLKEAPDFDKSLKYLDDNKKLFNKTVDSMINDLEEDNIKKLIREKLNDEHYISLYDELIFSDKFVVQYNDNKEMLYDIKDKYNIRFDACIDTLNFLKLYKDFWKLEDGEIKFANHDLLNYYNILMSRVSDN